MTRPAWESQADGQDLRSRRSVRMTVIRRWERRDMVAGDAVLVAGRARIMGARSMSRGGSVLVLTTREMNWWQSMQEIVPAVERVWTGVGQSGRQVVRMWRVDQASPEIERCLQTSAPHVDRIVIAAATPTTVRIALLLRMQVKVSAPMISYIHGDATTGFHAFGELVNVLTERDMFVVSCEAEAVAARCSFPNATVRVIPFSLVDEF